MLSLNKYAQQRILNAIISLNIITDCWLDKENTFTVYNKTTPDYLCG